MRIVHIITRMIIGGAQENTLLTCRDLIKEYGDEVLLITGPQTGPEGSLLDRVDEEGIPLETVHSLRRALHPWHDIRALGQIKKLLRRFQPDVVHTHSAKGGFLGRLAADALHVPAIVHTVHGAPFHRYQGRGGRALFRSLERHAAGKCHALVSVADAMTEQLVAAGVAPREKFTTIQSGFEVEPFLEAIQFRETMRRQFGFDNNTIVVGKIARLFHLKGHRYLIEAAKEVAEQSPSVRFLLVGDGILRERLQRTIADAGLTDRFVFAGLVPPQQIPAMIAAMDILVHVSLREGLAKTLPQALLAGKPVISYDIDGAREVVIPDETGLLLPPCSTEPLTSAIVRLAGDAALRHRLGDEGRRRFTDLFRHERMTRRLRELYCRLLEKK